MRRHFQRFVICFAAAATAASADTSNAQRLYDPDVIPLPTYVEDDGGRAIRLMSLEQADNAPSAPSSVPAARKPPVPSTQPATPKIQSLPADTLAPGTTRQSAPTSNVPGTIYPPAAVPIESVGTPQAIDLPGTTLQELEFIAMTGNPALREASARVGVAQGNAIQVGLLPNPGFFTSSPQWAGSISQYNAVFTQDFITAGKLRLSRATAQREVEQAQLGFTRTRFEVLTAVRRQFYTTATAQRRVEVLDQLLGVSTRSRDVGRKLLAAGEANRADATVLEIEYERASLSHLNAATTLEAAKKQLAAVVGAPDMEITRLKFDLTLPLPEYDLEVVRLGVVDRNAVAAIAAIEIQRTRWALQRAIAEKYPNFNIQAGFQYATEGPYHDQGYAQFTTSIPLWNRNQGGIRAARYDTARATAALQRTENDLSQQTAEALGTYLPAVERAKFYRERILPKAQEVYRVNGSLFEQGQTDILRLLQAQRTLIEADLGYLEAEEARWTSAATISGLLQQEQFP